MFFKILHKIEILKVRLKISSICNNNNKNNTVNIISIYSAKIKKKLIKLNQHFNEQQQKSN